jgi:hypothetical protein
MSVKMEFGDGKYKAAHKGGDNLEIARRGQPWMSPTHCLGWDADVVLALVQELEELRRKVKGYDALAAHALSVLHKEEQPDGTCVETRGQPQDFKLNKDQTVAVSTHTYWNHDMSTCPRGVTVQLLGAGGVATYGDYTGDNFWCAWCALPRRRKNEPI